MNNNQLFPRSIITHGLDTCRCPLQSVKPLPILDTSPISAPCSRPTHGKHHDHSKCFHAETAIYTNLQYGRLAHQPAPLDMPTSHPSPPALHQHPRHAPSPCRRRNRLLCLQGTVGSWTSAMTDVQIVSLVPCWRQAAPPARKQPCQSRHFMQKKKLRACSASAYHRVFKPARGEFKQAATAFPRLISRRHFPLINRASRFCTHHAHLSAIFLLKK